MVGPEELTAAPRVTRWPRRVRTLRGWTVKTGAEGPPVTVTSRLVAAEPAAFSAMRAAVRRPAWFVAPRWLVTVGAGEMAQILFFSQRGVPAAPLAAGFRFRYPELGAALRAVLS